MGSLEIKGAGRVLSSTNIAQPRTLIPCMSPIIADNVIKWSAYRLVFYVIVIQPVSRNV